MKKQILKKGLIKIFPLSLTILPKEHQKLHIFEPRYKQLMKDVINGDQCFGIPYFKGGTLYRFGTYVKIHKVSSYDPDTGEMDIIIEGVKTFELEKYLNTYEGKLYDSALIHWLDDSCSDNTAELNDLFAAYYAKIRADFDLIKNTEKYSSMYSIARFLPLTEQEKISFIGLKNPDKKRRFLSNKIKVLTRVYTMAKQLGENVYYN